MTGRRISSRGLAEKYRRRDCQNAGEPVQQRHRRRFQPALDLRQVVLGHASQPGHDRLRLPTRLAVEPDALADRDIGLASTRSAYGGTITSDHGMVDGHMMARTLVLWDVDHTLIETRGVGGELFREAFEQATGHKLVHAADVTGRTEPAIFRETAELHSIPYTDDLLDRYAQALAAGYRARMSDLAARGRAIPGAAAALAVLARAGGIVQSVLTGNLRAVAVIKLEVFGLAAELDLEVGAFGSDDPDRANLVRIAQDRARDKYRTDFGAHNTVLIGDTPSDIAAARDGGVRIVAIATGKSTVAELRQAGAAIALPGLENAAAVVEAVTDAL